MKWVEFTVKRAEKKGNSSNKTEKLVLAEKTQNDQNIDNADSENVNLEDKNDNETTGKKLNKRKKNNKKTGDKRKAQKKKKAAIIGVHTKEPEHAVVENKPNPDLSVANFGNEVNQGASTSGIQGKKPKKLSKKKERKRQEELALDEAYMNYFAMEARAELRKQLLVAALLAFLDDLGISIRF